MLNIEIKKEIIFSSTIFIFTFLLFWVLSGEKAKKDPSSHSELIVVFRKEISESESRRIMESTGNPYSFGADSSRGKAYFYGTGPKYIMHIGRAQKSAELFRLKNMDEICEVYEPDWNIQKD